MKDSEGNEVPGGKGCHIVVYEVAGDPETNTIRVVRRDAFCSFSFELQFHQAVRLSLALAAKAKEMTDEGVKRDLRNFNPGEGDLN